MIKKEKIDDDIKDIKPFPVPIESPLPIQAAQSGFSDPLSVQNNLYQPYPSYHQAHNYNSMYSSNYFAAQNSRYYPEKNYFYNGSFDQLQNLSLLNQESVQQSQQMIYPNYNGNNSNSNNQSYNHHQTAQAQTQIPPNTKLAEMQSGNGENNNHDNNYILNINTSNVLININNNNNNHNFQTNSLSLLANNGLHQQQQ
jgi:hypothetical protein